MNDFTFYTPTKVVFGKDTQKQVGSLLKEYGYTHVMLQYGQNSIKASGLYDEVMTVLAANDITVIEMGGVQPNPTVEFARRAVKTAKETGVQLILAVGGGSVLDSAKATAAGALYDGDVWDFFCGKATVQQALPVGCILTMAAAGSEMSASAVLTNTELSMKRGFGSEHNRCLFAICNPELTYSVGRYQTACGIVDMMTHTMERYFTPYPPTDLTDRLSEGLLCSLIDAGRRLLSDPRDYEARATVMWGSSLSHNGLTGCFRANALAVHQLEHALSGEFETIAHGAGLAVLYPAWARYVYAHDLPRFAQFARRVWGVTHAEDQAAAVEGIERMASFFRELGLPATLKELGVPRGASARLADLCTFGKQRVVPSLIPLDYEHIRTIFDRCYE